MIERFEEETEEIIFLELNEVAAYIDDNWGWDNHFYSINAHYSANCAVIALKKQYLWKTPD